ncbi:4-hydroxy-3-methylbut-2-enyl diphosphate reductase, partial [Streptomyces durbertensis]
MNRSVLCEEFHTTALPVAPGTLTVASTWWHPTRGAVECPAHQLVAAHLRHAGHRVDHRPLPGPLQPSRVLGDASSGAVPGSHAATAVVAVSYEMPDGHHRGLAIAVRAEEHTLVQLARRQIDAWRAVLRTRRVLHVAPPPAPAPRPRGPIPRQSASPTGTLWRPCGCPTWADCRAQELARRTTRRLTEEGETVIVVGTHTAVPWPTRPKAPSHDGLDRVATTAQAAALTVDRPDRLAFVVAPGSTVSQVAAVLNVLRARFPLLRGQHPDEWCYTMDDLHTAVGSVLAQSDALVIAGHGTSPTVSVATGMAGRARKVTTLDRLRPSDVNVATVAVLDTEDGGPRYRQVIEALDGLGPTSHVWRRVHTGPRPPRTVPHRT